MGHAQQAVEKGDSVLGQKQQSLGMANHAAGETAV